MIVYIKALNRRKAKEVSTLPNVDISNGYDNNGDPYIYHHICNVTFHCAGIQVYDTDITVIDNDGYIYDLKIAATDYADILLT